MSNKLIKSKSSTPLVLNESADSTKQNKKYIFSGIFTACSVPGHVVINRNQRSYPEKTVLAHLSYLREMIKESGCILGELDHPEGRFDVQLKEASHKITDLWYDMQNHNVMGKLELLDTPNGKIAQELVESGYPLFVSSRAAGDVDEKTHEVEIAQIFTYDIVCTPGFQEAKLNRVNESKLGNMAYSYLNESLSTQKKEQENTKKKYKVNIAGVSVNEIDNIAPLNEKFMNMKNSKININNLSKPLLEEDEEFKLPEADVSPIPVKSDDSKNDKENDKSSDKSDDKNDENNKDKSNPTEEEKQENRQHILNITGEMGDGDSSDEPFDDEDKMEKRSHILSIEGQVDDDNSSDDLFNDEGEDDKEEADDKKDSKETSEDSKTSTMKAEEIAQETKKDMDKFQNLLDNFEKKEEIKEQIIKNYPFAISLSENNFAKFAALSPNQKKKCMKFIVEHNIFEIKDINDQFMIPLQKEKRSLKNWLRLADKKDIELYTQASLQEQDAIENMARYMILETKQDVDEFWAKTGLREREAQRIQNEEFIRKYQIQQKPIMKQLHENQHPLGYAIDYIALTEQMYNN